MKVLVVGPSWERSKGGMSTVIQGIMADRELNQKFSIDIYESYIDGSRWKVAAFSLFSFFKFLISKREYDIYHIHMASRGSTFRKSYYVRAAKRWNKKVIIHMHGAEYMKFYRQLSPKKQTKVAGILKSADMVIALSEEWKRQFEKEIHLDNCYVLKNGIDTRKFCEAITDTEKVKNNFLFLGRLGQRKGVYDLLAAAETAVRYEPNIKLFLAGDGEIEKVKGVIAEKKLEKNVKVVGWIDFNEKLKLLQKVAAVVLPSYNEGLPMAILEGMASGKVIVSTTVGAIPEVVPKENGILVTPGDTKALAEALLRCVSDKEFLHSVAKNNVAKARNEFDSRIIHKKLGEYYEKVMETEASGEKI